MKLIQHWKDRHSKSLFEKEEHEQIESVLQDNTLYVFAFHVQKHTHVFVKNKHSTTQGKSTAFVLEGSRVASLSSVELRKKPIGDVYTGKEPTNTPSFIKGCARCTHPPSSTSADLRSPHLTSAGPTRQIQ